jgi:hypothetical protein
MMTPDITPAHLRSEDILPAWRAAVLAYQRKLRATREDRHAWPAAYAAFREVLPEMPEAEAKQRTTHAIAFAAANHTKWFWGGVYGSSGEQPIGHGQSDH